MTLKLLRLRIPFNVFDAPVPCWHLVCSITNTELHKRAPSTSKDLSQRRCYSIQRSVKQFEMSYEHS